jgi:hypothetical protein
MFVQIAVLEDTEVAAFVECAGPDFAAKGYGEAFLQKKVTGAFVSKANEVELTALFMQIGVDALDLPTLREAFLSMRAQPEQAIAAIQRAKLQKAESLRQAAALVEQANAESMRQAAARAAAQAEADERRRSCRQCSGAGHICAICRRPIWDGERCTCVFSRPFCPIRDHHDCSCLRCHYPYGSYTGCPSCNP